MVGAPAIHCLRGRFIASQQEKALGKRGRRTKPRACGEGRTALLLHSKSTIRLER